MSSSCSSYLRGSGLGSCRDATPTLQRSHCGSRLTRHHQTQAPCQQQHQQRSDGERDYSSKVTRSPPIHWIPPKSGSQPSKDEDMHGATRQAETYRGELETALRPPLHPHLEASVAGQRCLKLRLVLRVLLPRQQDECTGEALRHLLAGELREGPLQHAEQDGPGRSDVLLIGIAEEGLLLLIQPAHMTTGVTTRSEQRQTKRRRICGSRGRGTHCTMLSRTTTGTNSSGGLAPRATKHCTTNRSSTLYKDDERTTPTHKLRRLS